MRLIKFLILAPVAALLLAFAFANREWVTISFDPTELSGVAPVQAPQFLVLLIATGLGVIAGGAMTWIGQGRHRRAARDAQVEAARLRAELQASRLSAPTQLARQA